MPPRVWLLFLAVSCLSGSVYLFIDLAVEDLPPVVVACVRATLGAAILLPIAVATGALRGLGGARPRLAVLGALEFALPFLLVSAGADRIASSLVGVLMATGPLLVVLFALRLDASERVSGVRLAGLVVGLGGVLVLLGLEVAGEPRELVGAALVLAGSASFALGALWLRRHFAEAPPVGVVAGAMGAGALLLAPFALAAVPADAPSGTAILALGVLGTAHAAVNYVLFFRLVQLAGAGRATVTAYVAPAVAVLLGVVVLDEPAGIGLVAGLALVVAGSWLGTGGRGRGRRVSAHADAIS